MGKHGSFWDNLQGRRISRRRALQAAAVTGASAGAIALVGCGGDDDGGGTEATKPAGGGDQGTPVQGGTLKLSTPLVLGKDPHKAATFLTHALASYSYNRLLRFKTQPGELSQDQWYTYVPELASKVENPDPLTYIFTLREDVKNHNLPPVNGRLFNADDVIWSFERYRSISPNKGNMSMVDSLTKSADGKTVTFKLKEPFGLFLNRVASFQDLWIMPREFVEQSETASEDSMLGTGPYLFEKFDAGKSISWTRNPDYFEKPYPYLNGVSYAIITDQNQVLSQFASGTLDAIFVPPKLVASVKSQVSSAIIDPAPRNVLSFIYFEPASFTEGKKPFEDERVRQALSMALDRESLLDLASPEGGKFASMPINAGFGESWYLDPQGSDFGDNAKYYTYDPKTARDLLSAAGAADFETAMHFSTTLYSTIVPYYDAVRQAIPAMLKEVGMSVKDAGEEYGVYITKTFGRGEFDGFTYGLESVFSDIALYYTNMFYPRDAGGGRNHSSVDDPELQANIKKMLAETDIDEIHRQNFDLQRYLAKKCWYVPVVTPVEFGARTPRLKGLVNTKGPTTYGVGTERDLTPWFGGA